MSQSVGLSYQWPAFENFFHVIGRRQRPISSEPESKNQTGVFRRWTFEFQSWKRFGERRRSGILNGKKEIVSYFVRVMGKPICGGNAGEDNFMHKAKSI